MTHTLRHKTLLTNGSPPQTQAILAGIGNGAKRMQGLNITVANPAPFVFHSLRDHNSASSFPAYVRDNSVTTMKLNLGPLGHFALTRDTRIPASPQRHVVDASCQTDELTQIGRPYQAPQPSDDKRPSPPQPSDDEEGSSPPPYAITVSALLSELEHVFLLNSDAFVPPDINMPKKRKECVVPPGAQKLPDAQNQLHRYVMELTAFALDANFDELNSALYKQPITSKTNTILTDDEREELAHLSRLIHKLFGKLRRNQSNTIPRSDMMQVHAAVSDPARRLDLNDYALDLVESYAGYAEDSDVETARRTKTVLAHWERNPREWTIDPEQDLKYSLSTCAWVIQVVSYPDEQVQNILGRALERYQRRCGVEFVEYQNYCHPTREPFSELWKYMLWAHKYKEKHNS